MLHINLACLCFSLFFYTLKAEETTCRPGLFGNDCNINCSSGCRDKKCKLGSDGTAPCTDGCEPGWYGSLCRIPCQSPGNSCQECSNECEDGFCQLGSRCVSGCVDSFYGTGCFTCEPDRQVCNKRTKRCYNCTDGCQFSSCYLGDQGEDQLRTTLSLPSSNKTDKITIYGAVFGSVSFLVVIILVFLMHRYKRSLSASCVGLFRTSVSRDSSPEVSLSWDAGLDMNPIELSTMPAYAVVIKKKKETSGDGYDTMSKNQQEQCHPDLYEDIN